MKTAVPELPVAGYSSDGNYVPHPHEPIFYLIFLVKCVVLVLGLVGNGLIVFIFVRHRAIRSATNMYIMNIAVTDLLVTISCPLVMIITDLAGTWPLDAITCRFSQATMEFSTCATVLALTAVSIERYYAVVHPIERYLSTQRLSVAVNLIIWAVALVFSAPKFVYSGIRNERLNGTRGFTTVTYCAYNGESSFARYMSLIDLFLFYVIPFLVVCSLYWIVSRHLRENSKTISCRLSTAGRLRQVHMNNKVVTMVQVLSAIFFVGFMPYNILRLRVYLFGDNKTYWTTTAASYAYCFGCLHFWLNPIAMYFLCDTFRKRYNQYLFCCFIRRKAKQVVTEGDKDTERPDTTFSNAPNSDTILQKYDTGEDYEFIEIGQSSKTAPEGRIDLGSREYLN